MSRFYSGSVAHLMLFNDALEPEHVAGLYAAYRRNASADAPGGACRERRRAGWRAVLKGALIRHLPPAALLSSRLRTRTHGHDTTHPALLLTLLPPEQASLW